MIKLCFRSFLPLQSCNAGSKSTPHCLSSKFEVLTQHSSVQRCLCYSTRSGVQSHLTCSQEADEKGKSGKRGSKRRCRKVTAVAVSNCVDESQTSFISPSHSLPSSLSIFSLHPLLFSLSLQPKIMRSVPSQGPFHIKTLSSIILLNAHSFSVPHPSLHATGLLLATPILGHALSL